MKDKSLLLEMLTQQDSPITIQAQKRKEPLTIKLTKAFCNFLILFTVFAMLAGPTLIIRAYPELPALILALIAQLIVSINALNAIKTFKEDIEKGFMQ